MIPSLYCRVNRKSFPLCFPSYMVFFPSIRISVTRTASTEIVSVPNGVSTEISLDPPPKTSGAYLRVKSLSASLLPSSYATYPESLSRLNLSPLIDSPVVLPDTFVHGDNIHIQRCGHVAGRNVKFQIFSI